MYECVPSWGGMEGNHIQTANLTLYMLWVEVPNTMAFPRHGKTKTLEHV